VTLFDSVTGVKVGLPIEFTQDEQVIASYKTNKGVLQLLT